MELDKKALDSLPVYLIEGRLPENGNEVLISEHVLSNGGVDYKIGEQIELELGQRYLDGYVLNQSNPFTFEDEGEKEELKITETRKFTVVGICKRLPYEIEGYSAPGYSIITKLDDTSITFGKNEKISAYIKLKNPRKVYDFESDISKKYVIESVIYNDDVLRYEGISNIDGFNRVLYGLASIVMVLIMVGSVSLIYNSFSISVSERRKQFGLLSSVGATRKQLINSVLYEALVIGSIGIPFGIGSGILGIGVTLYLLRDNFIRMFGERYPVELSLSVSVASVIVAVVVSIVTILISAYIPARRAKKISAMDAVRQTMDIKLTARNVKTSALTRKIFGIEGDIALK
ncbi:MAG TPA: FtsX-like permease family protein, partial [Mobilitalea sp.]|nr:FtsX-like permease family protein [Mobilitalea sp.]